MIQQLGLPLLFISAVSQYFAKTNHEFAIFYAPENLLDYKFLNLKTLGSLFFVAKLVARDVI